MNPQVKSCLEEHKGEEGFSKACRLEIDAMVERRVSDFRLDSRLQAVCKDDIANICSFYSVSFPWLSELRTVRSHCIHCWVCATRRCAEMTLPGAFSFYSVRL